LEVALLEYTAFAGMVLVHAVQVVPPPREKVPTGHSWHTSFTLKY
jgi:hypothetical protein